MSIKKSILFSLLTIGTVAVSFNAPAQNCFDKYWGTKKLYVPQDTAFVAPPEGYKTVLINHVTRHGARHLSSLKDLTTLQHILDEAEVANGLTEYGVRLQRMVNLLSKIETKRNVGLLTQVGMDEQQGIGRRMEEHDAGLIENPLTLIKVVATKVERTKQSAASFMQGLGHVMQNSDDVQLIDEDSISLRFFEISPGYRQFKKSGNWHAEINKLTDSPEGKENDKNILLRFFKNDYVQKLSQPDNTKNKGQEFTNTIFDVAMLPAAASKEIISAGLAPENVNIRSLFTCEELAWLEKKSSAEDFLLKGPGMNANGIQVRNAVPLLINFLRTTDTCLSDGRPAAVLRFAHAETIAPFATLLGIKGMATSTGNIADFEKVWNAGNVMGYSANIQWIFYKSADPKKETLVKILYNEKSVEIPVATTQFPYYSWKDVRAYYIKKIADWHVSLNDDMLAYLQALK